MVLAWIVIGAAWLLNRDWFTYTRDAFSDLGGKGSCCPQLYNTGLIIVGLLLIAYGACATLLSRNKLETLGAGYIALAGVFLALIGVFPTGTRPHTFVSTWFFIQADLALTLLLTGQRRQGCRTPYNTTALLATLLAFPAAGLVEAIWGWPSAAVLETYGILVIDYAALTTWHCIAHRQTGHQ